MLTGDIPDGVKSCLFAWERGTKLFVTEAEAVNQNTHAVFWKQYLRQVSRCWRVPPSCQQVSGTRQSHHTIHGSVRMQTATLYKENNELLPKDYSFKVQSVKKDSKGEDKRKTIGNHA